MTTKINEDSIIITKDMLSEFGLITSAIYGVIVGEIKASDYEICSIPQSAIGKALGVTRVCVSSNIKPLLDNGIIKCLNENELGATRLYALPGKGDIPPQVMTSEFYPSIFGKQTRQKRKVAGYIYLIEALYPVQSYKIGRTKSVKKRMNVFNVKLPFEWNLIHLFCADDYFRAEVRLQGQFEDKRINGEWFDLVDEDIEYITTIAKYQNGKFIPA